MHYQTSKFKDKCCDGSLHLDALRVINQRGRADPAMPRCSLTGVECVNLCRWVPGLPGLDKVARTVDSPTAMINYLRTLPAEEVRHLATLRQHVGKTLACA